MNKAKFILEKKKVVEQYNKLRELGVQVSYSYKTNRDVGKVLSEKTDSDFSIHNINEIEHFDVEARKAGKLWFFSQAWHEEEIAKIISSGVKNFVVDNEKDLEELMNFLNGLKFKTNQGLSIKNQPDSDRLIESCEGDGKFFDSNFKINLLLRMKFQEHRIHSGKYFDYGMPARKVNELILKLKDFEYIDKIGVHIHRKSQNASEWEIKQELEDSLDEEVLMRINIVNLGGGLPIKYRTYTAEILPYIFGKIKEVREWLPNVEIYVEPGRFIAGPSVKLECEILQVYDNIVVINTSIYNCALDTIITDIRMLVEGELEENDKEGEWYKVKGNSPTRDDIFRHKVKLDIEGVKVGEKLVFLNAGAYNYSTDFCGFEKLETEII